MKHPPTHTLTHTHLSPQVMSEVHKARSLLSPDLPLRDHRPLTCNADDHARMAAVPHKPRACFRDMPGIVSNSDGVCVCVLGGGGAGCGGVTPCFRAMPGLPVGGVASAGGRGSGGPRG